MLIQWEGEEEVAEEEKSVLIHWGGKRKRKRIFTSQSTSGFGTLAFWPISDEDEEEGEKCVDPIGGGRGSSGRGEVCINPMGGGRRESSLHNRLPVSEEGEEKEKEEDEDEGQRKK